MPCSSWTHQHWLPSKDPVKDPIKDPVKDPGAQRGSDPQGWLTMSKNPEAFKENPKDSTENPMRIPKVARKSLKNPKNIIESFRIPQKSMRIRLRSLQSLRNPIKSASHRKESLEISQTPPQIPKNPSKSHRILLKSRKIPQHPTDFAPNPKKIPQDPNKSCRTAPRKAINRPIRILCSHPQSGFTNPRADNQGSSTHAIPIQSNPIQRTKSTQLLP